jgi:hypothetical protein
LRNVLVNRRPCSTSTSDRETAFWDGFDFSDIIFDPAVMRYAKFEALGDRSEGAFDDVKSIRFQDYFYDSQKSELTIRE